MPPRVSGWILIFVMLRAFIPCVLWSGFRPYSVRTAAFRVFQSTGDRIDSRYNHSYTDCMKTAISVPSEIFNLSERLAKKLQISRSAVFALGVQKLGEELDDNEITRRLNEYYSKERAKLDPAIVQMAALSLPKEEW